MALVPCGESVRVAGQNVPVLRDADDLDDLSYHYYRKAEKLGKTLTKLAIINGRLTGEDIESNPERYAELLK